MALSINGTTGISGVDGSNASPAIQGTDSNTGLSFASDTVNINTGGTTRMTVDSTGNVGIGTTSPSHLLEVNGNISLGNGGSSGGAEMLRIHNDNGVERIDATNNPSALAFGMGGTGSSYERMRISSDGGLFLGVTSAVSSSSGGVCFRTNDSDRKELLMGTTTTSTKALIEFINSNGGVGSISVSGSNTSYNTSSDYRLKENVTTISDGITRLKTLKPSRFNFIADAETTVDGFLAHEVTAVPEAITGTKDEVATEDSVSHKKGDPIYQSIDQSKLVPLLTAALQEAVAKIEVLETKVAALEAG